MAGALLEVAQQGAVGVLLGKVSHRVTNGVGEHRRTDPQHLLCDGGKPEFDAAVVVRRSRC